MSSQQHSLQHASRSPFTALPPYYPGSQQTLSLEASSTAFSDLDTMDSSQSIGFVLAEPFPPYYPIALTNNLGIVPKNPDIVKRLPHHFPPHVHNGIFSTPIKQCIGTARLPNEQSKISVDKLTQLLQKELLNSHVYGNDFIPLIFPNQLLPIPVNSSLFKKLAAAKIWDPSKSELILKPSSSSKNHVAKWLNSLAKEIGKCFPGLEVKRSWYAGNKMVPPKGSAIV